MSACLHSSSRLVKVVDTAGREMYACQCVVCGGEATAWLPQKLIKYPEAVSLESEKPPTIRDLMEPMRRKLQELREEAWKLRRSFYENYLQSPAWQAKRRVVLARSGGTCEKCRAKKAVDIHHVTYERLGNEAPEDLLALCRGCHEEEHEIEKQRAIGPVTENANA